jgi:hypothetical protein
MTNEELKQLKELCTNATPGPWRNDCGNGEVETLEWRVPICRRVGNFERREEATGTYRKQHPEVKHLLSFDNEADMDFIAEARTAIPKLIEEVERLREALEFISCPGKDDGDFHNLDLFEAHEIAIAMANRAREALGGGE